MYIMPRPDADLAPPQQQCWRDRCTHSNSTKPDALPRPTDTLIIRERPKQVPKTGGCAS